MRHGHAIQRVPDDLVPEPRPEQASARPEQLPDDSQTQVVLVRHQSPVAEQTPVHPDRPFLSETFSSGASDGERPEPFHQAMGGIPDHQALPKDCFPGIRASAAGRWASAVHPEAEAAHCTSGAVPSAASPRDEELAHSPQELREPQPPEPQPPAQQQELPQQESQQEPLREQLPLASPLPAQREESP